MAVRYDIFSEPTYTCPIVDNAQKEINSVKDVVESDLDSLGACALRDLEDSICTVKKTIHDELDNLVKALEDVRRCNIELRDWGQAWTGKAEDLEKESSNKDEEIQRLESKVEELEGLLEELKVSA
jgi:wobble nucleotide-excising tRNase